MKSKRFEGLRSVDAIAAETPRRQPGRPKGSGMSSDAQQVSLYLSHELYKRARIALLEDDDERPFSKLVDDLVAEWLKQRK